MKLSSIKNSRTGLAVVCAAAALSGLAAIRAHADGWDKKTILTVDQTIQVRDTVLPPGKYVMKLYDSPAQRHVVQIFNEDQSHIINTVMAIPTQRMEPTGDTQFTFWETPAGHARALRAWYYPGDTIGNEFPYPKNPKLLVATAMVTETTTTPTARAEAEFNRTDDNVQPENATVETKTEANAVETPVVEEKPVEEAKPVEETPVVTEDNNAAEQPQTPANDSSAASSSSSSSELPKTGSPYPLIGLGGALMLALAGLLRFARTA